MGICKGAFLKSSGQSGDMYPVCSLCNRRENEHDAPVRLDDAQVGGDHYKNMKMTPWDFIEANMSQIGFFEGEIIVYVARWRKKDGIKDLLKARHTIDKLLSIAEKEAADAVKERRVTQRRFMPIDRRSKHAPFAFKERRGGGIRRMGYERRGKNKGS